MKLYEFADIIDKEIEVTRFPNQNNRWIAKFKNCDIKGNGVLIGAYGDSGSPDAALDDYLSQIKGKTLVFDAVSSKRSEYKFPSSI